MIERGKAWSESDGFCRLPGQRLEKGWPVDDEVKAGYTVDDTGREFSNELYRDAIGHELVIIVALAWWRIELCEQIRRTTARG